MGVGVGVGGGESEGGGEDEGGGEGEGRERARAEGGSGMVSAEGGGEVQEEVVALEELVAPADERVVSKLDRLH